MKVYLTLLTLIITSSLMAHAEYITPFTSDGCSSSPDAILGTSIVHCCIAHDFDYWLGGEQWKKSQADENLKACIQKSLPYLAFFGNIYELGVIIGGRPMVLKHFNSPFPWRWSYGWLRNKGYNSLSKEELTLGLGELEALDSNFESHERALNETDGFAWRFRGLNISEEQFKIIRQALREKIASVQAELNSL